MSPSGLASSPSRRPRGFSARLESTCRKPAPQCRKNTLTFSDPFGLRADTAFADERARTETQKCVSESQTCADLIGALAKDENLWTISTTSIADEDELGE